jgi:DNA polymerase I-like protein with 3'-5' exonuclease and polymerase domains|tara:strand:- start:146 stop:2014 length:1869 start_codon:yes stop_codon:yes gene_type:complete
MKMPFFKAQTEWICPENFPDLSDHEYVAIDLETKDPNLKTKGSGSVIGQGEIIGIAVAVEGWSGYYPIGHREGNMDKKKVLEWITKVCAADNTKIFHNAMYDVCWLKSYGIKINGFVIDTMVMLSLIDENRRWYSLNSASYDYLGEVKNEQALKEAAEAAGVDAKSEMYKLPAMYVGSYAEKDAELTLELFRVLSREIQKQNLQNVFDLETNLFPCLVDMRFNGVRVDVERAHTLKQKLVAEEEELLLQVKKETGIETQIWAARSIAQVFDKLSLPYSRTLKSNAPSFTKNFLKEHPHPLVQKIAKAREINKAHTTFIDTILKHEHKGRIHADINPIKSDQGGTVTGRFSYSNPNLQQIPARNKDLGPMIRGLFIPEKDCKWGCFDYSQQEPRLVVHYAATTEPICFNDSVTKIVEKFKHDSVDFHQTVADMANISRSQAKTINLGLFYGMGKAKLQAELGLNTKQEAEDLFDQYHDKVPFVRELMNRTSSFAQTSGSIGTLLGRKCRFDKWEPATFGMHTPMTLEEAERTYGRGRIRRAFTYKALNKLIQGSAADMTKKAMLDLYREGIIPHIQIHDELDLSVESPERAKKIIEIMENAVTLKVPNKVDYESGETWGDIYD